MRLRYFLFIAILSGISFAHFSCKSETETLETEELSSYLPLVPGKYITYRIDSLVFPNFGRAEEIHRYQVKHVVDAMITDNLGRPSFRIYRYLNDSTASGPWVSDGSYMITPESKPDGSGDIVFGPVQTSDRRLYLAVLTRATDLLKPFGEIRHDNGCIAG